MLRQVNKSAIKVIDLGSACYDDEKIYSYIQSRFYRAPEIMLGIPYTQAIDMWSFGCIVIELYIGYPIFPGETEKEQFQYIMETMGLPPNNLLDMATRKEIFFNEDGTPKLEKNSRGKIRQPGTKSLSSIM